MANHSIPAAGINPAIDPPTGQENPVDADRSGSVAAAGLVALNPPLPPPEGTGGPPGQQQPLGDRQQPPPPADQQQPLGDRQQPPPPADQEQPPEATQRRNKRHVRAGWRVQQKKIEFLAMLQEKTADIVGWKCAHRGNWRRRGGRGGRGGRNGEQGAV